jgi:predicted ATPase
MSAWFLGFPDEAMAYAHRSGELATRLGHAYSRLVTRLGFMLLGVLRGEVEVVRGAAEEAFAISSRLGVPNYLAVAKVYLGWCRALSGENDAGLAQIEEGLAGCRAVGAERNLASYELLLAEACLECGQARPGLAAVAEAERLIERTGEIRWTAEALRMRGELSLVAGEPRRIVEPPLAKALEVATAQGARGFMLRSATSLARVRTGERSDDARRMLETIYGAYDQGAETADLRRARGLLEELGS